MSWQIKWFWSFAARALCMPLVRMEKPLRIYHSDRKRKQQEAGDTCHVLTQLGLVELPHCYLASPALPVPEACQDCVPVKWNTQWMAAVASPLSCLVLTMSDLCLSRTAFNLIHTGHYLSLLWIGHRWRSIYCNLKPGKIQKKDTTKCIVHVGCRVSISEWFSFSHWSHSLWQVHVFVCLVPSSPKAGI